MKTYEGLFGVWGVRVKARNIKEAREKILQKVKTYKENSDKRKCIENYLKNIKGFTIIEVGRYRGCYIQLKGGEKYGTGGFDVKSYC